jgi:hypothetical protein
VSRAASSETSCTLDGKQLRQRVSGSFEKLEKIRQVFQSIDEADIGIMKKALGDEHAECFRFRC